MNCAVNSVPVEDQVPLAAKETVHVVGEVASNLRHKRRVWVVCDARDVDGASCVMNDEQDVVRHQATCGPDLGGQKVGARDHVGVRLEKGPSGGRTLRCRSDAVVLQRLGDG